MNNIEDFRIREQYVKFYIERKFVEKTITGFWFWKRTTEDIVWRRTDSRGNKIYWRLGGDLTEPMQGFPTKDEAVAHLKMICTPPEYYYPISFEKENSALTVPTRDTSESHIRV